MRNGKEPMAQYHLARDGQQLGTFSEEEVKSGLAAGRFSPSDLHWTDGMGDWQPVSARFNTQPIYAPGAATSSVGGSVGLNPYAAPAANVTPVGLNNVVLASLGARFGAAMLDGLVAAVFIGIPYAVFIAQVQGMKPAGSQELPEFSPTAMIALGVMLLAGLALLIINCVMLAKRGQTLGKRWLGIRIVEFPGTAKPGFVKAVLLRAFVNGIIGAIPCLGGIYSLTDICFIFREDRRCIHDLIAGTQVIVGQPEA